MLKLPSSVRSRGEERPIDREDVLRFDVTFAHAKDARSLNVEIESPRRARRTGVRYRQRSECKQRHGMSDPSSWHDLFA